MPGAWSSCVRPLHPRQTHGLPFEARRDEAEDAKARGESTAFRDRLRADAAMRRRQAHGRPGIPAQATCALECHDVGRIDTTSVPRSADKTLFWLV